VENKCKLEIRFVERGMCPTDKSTNRHNTAIFSLPLLYLTSQSCYSTPVFINTRKFWQFGHKYGLFCIFFIAHAWNGRFSTSGLKSDIAIVFLGPHFLGRAHFGDSATNKSYIAYFFIAHARITVVFPRPV